MLLFFSLSVSGKSGLSGVTKELKRELWEALEGHFWTWLAALTVYPQSSQLGCEWASGSRQLLAGLCSPL